jgi:MoxR-like ATPase
MSFTAETEVEDIIGKVAYDPEKGTIYKMGRLPLAWQRARVLLLDEPNTAPNAVWQRIRPLTDNNKQLVLDESYDAEPIDRYPFCFMLMAMNPPWDSGNIGAETLSHADMDRLAHIFMDLPPRDVEREILRSACERDGWSPSQKILEGVLDNSEEIRRLVDDGSLPINWGVRPNLKVIRHLKWYDPATAYKRAILDAIEPEAAKMVLKTIGSAGRL